MERKRIAIFTHEDYTWAFPTWAKTIPALARQHDVVGLYLFPKSLGKNKGRHVALWYLRTFGLWSFILLSLYAIKTRLARWLSSPSTWESLAGRHNLDLRKSQSPNATEVCRWVKENRIDAIFIMVDQILKVEIVKAPRLGIINKHASLLPSCRGLFPYFWARLHGLPTGVSFHKVEAGVDAGTLLAQRRHDSAGSMLRFYIDVFAMYPALALEALGRLIHQETVVPCVAVEPSYFSLPTRDDARRFRRSNRIARFSDLVYQPSVVA